MAKLLDTQIINAISVKENHVHSLDSFITQIQDEVEKMESEEVEQNDVGNAVPQKSEEIEQNDVENAVPQKSVDALTKFLSEQRTMFTNKDTRLSFKIGELDEKILEAKKNPAEFEKLLKETRAAFKDKGRFGFFSHNPLDQYFDATFKLKDVPQSAWKLGCGGW